MRKGKCQKCGRVAARVRPDKTEYDCGSYQFLHGAFIESKQCLRNQLAQKNDELTYERSIPIGERVWSSGIDADGLVETTSVNEYINWTREKKSL